MIEIKAENPKPLSGLRILNTRPELQAASLSFQLSALGALVLEFPLFTTIPLDANDAIAKALQVSNSSSWLAFTSANAVHHLSKAVRQPLRLRLFELPAAVVGNATAAAAQKAGFAVTFVARQSNAADFAYELLEVFEQRHMRPRSVIGLRARQGVPDFKNRLLDAGVNYHEAIVYSVEDLVVTKSDQERLAELITSKELSCTIITSGSAVKKINDCLISSGTRDSSRLAPLIVIGPQTQRIAEELGFPVVAVAKSAGSDQLVEAIVETAEELGCR